ncbi:MAG: glycosyltransferase family 4 protein [Myxococcales bacterium]|nr:glycosyltransferase family 4 protein [Myxococcales bacterium]
MPIRVLHLTRDFPPHRRGGLSTAVEGIATVLDACGLASSVVSFEGFRPSRDRGRGAEPLQLDHDGGVPVRRVRRPAQLEALRAQLADQLFDCVHVHDALLADLGIELARARERPLIAGVHVLQRHQNRLRGLDHPTASSEAEARLVGAAERVVVPSRAAADQLLRDYPACEASLCVAPLGVGPRRQAALDGPPHAVSAGRFGDAKGTMELLRAIAILGAAHPELRFTIAGGMPDNGKAERRWLARARDILTPEVHGRVRFAGWLAPAALATVLESATLFLAPSWYESFGLSLLEAMAHGLPIASTDAGGVVELVRHREHGLLCPPRDGRALADAALELLASAAEAARMGRAARARAQAHFDWPVLRPALQRVYG